jgi:hypothetical protein
MSLGSWLYQKTCLHKSLAIRVTDLNNPTMTTNKNWREVVCIECGKIVVPDWDFDAMERLFSGKEE